MIQLTERQLKKLQMVELELLTEFDRICRKNNIYYSLTGGTLLGAVRHKGFIPWDDDADVSMMRNEYERFLQVCKTDLDVSRFYLQHIHNTPGYRWGYAKLRKKGTLFLREHQENMPYEQGIFLDIFPRDGIPDHRVTRMIHSFRCYFLRKIMWSAVGRTAHPWRTGRVWFSLLYKCCGDRFVRMYDRLVEDSNRKETKLVRTVTFPVAGGYKGYQKRWYQEYKEVLFEGKEFLVEAGYLEWLSQEFGDYMELPPVEKRKVHPVVDIGFGDDLVI